MTRGRPRLAVACLLAATLVVASDQAARGQPLPRMSANHICSTPQGWCPVQVGYPVGTPCYCFVPPSTTLQGQVVQCRWDPPVNLYINPHRPCL